MFHCLDILENERFERATSFVEKINKLSREIPGGEVFHNLGVAREEAGKLCPLCRLRGCCLGPNCLGNSGHVTYL